MLQWEGIHCLALTKGGKSGEQAILSVFLFDRRVSRMHKAFVKITMALTLTCSAAVLRASASALQFMKRKPVVR